ncbi:MAG TPA: gephyrin-like molybdotransferase Glp [Acidimicrobiales bacterium]|nr:gephyrin-like molybdotransferase Glp [Acidimicrobiales bacterium]
MSLVPLDEARRHVLSRCAPLAPVRVAVADALGLVTAEAVGAAEDVPPFDNTAMDGYAVRAADTAGAPVRLSVLGTLAAGAAPGQGVGPGQAVRIMTGAPIPAGADAVVMVELTRAADDGRAVVVEAEVETGNHIRRRGDDVRRGDEVLAAGTVLGPGHLGVLASVGVPEVVVHPRLRVAVLSTGDELVDGGGALAGGQVRDSNRPTLLGLVRQAGFEALDAGIARDSEEQIEKALTGALAESDAVITSGGVSMGDFDLIKVVLDRLGDMRWMQVAIRPAKPLAFGRVGGKPVFGLPGNPVSSMVSFELFAGPALRKMAGHRVLDRPLVPAVAEEALARRPDGKTMFARVRARPGPDGRLLVRSAGGQGSHVLTAMAAAQGLAVLPDGEGVGAGEAVDVLLVSPGAWAEPGRGPDGAVLFGA